MTSLHSNYLIDEPQLIWPLHEHSSPFPKLIHRPCDFIIFHARWQRTKG
jgi:hypothetical protein